MESKRIHKLAETLLDILIRVSEGRETELDYECLPQAIGALGALAKAGYLGSEEKGGPHVG